MSPDVFPVEGENPFRGSTSVQLEGFADSTQVGTGPPREPIHVRRRINEQLMEHVQRYLQHTGDSSTRGRVLALVGEFGLGKSHLAAQVTDVLRESTPLPALWVIGQPSVDMRSVFQHRVMSPHDDIEAMADFMQAITDYYADVTAELLEQDDTGRLGAAREEFLRGLRDRRLDPQKIARAFDLDEELIHSHLRRHLRGVTDHRAFATALALLPNQVYQEDIFNWLSGEAPAPPLQQRGVTQPIQGIQGVFEAFAVFSLVYGQSDRPYALVLDEVDKIVDWTAQDRALFLNAFEMLVNRYVNQGGLLVFCVRPDLWSSLPASLHERVLPLWLDSWERPATEELIKQHLLGSGRVPPDKSCAPFSDPAVTQIVTLSDGVPRQILRICEGAWDHAALSRSPKIDTEAVHEAIRTTHEKRPMGEAARLLERVLAGDQWWHNVPPRDLADLPGPPGSGEPRWIEVTRTAWIVLLPVRSLLTRSGVGDIAGFLGHARDVAGSAGIEMLVVVNGHACRQMRRQVADATGTMPLVLDDPRFDTALRSGVQSLAERLRASRDSTVLEKLSNRLDVLQGQQQTLLERVDSIDHSLDNPRILSPAPTADSLAERLPEPVRAHFREAQEALDRLLEEGEGPRLSLVPVTRSAAGRPPRPRRLLVDDTALRSMGAVVLARRLLEAFRDAIVGWWEAEASGGDTERLAGRDQGELFAICRGFEISLESLPRLDRGGADPLSGSPGAATDPGERAQDRLADLADRVLRELGEAFSGGSAPRL
ncbi:hypothetical protein [Streptomyces sp. enrichment culture]|uniref:hypothetical protein n=1 Tax=Streptomyces sp. enrichment culture TaxID=1795815 RepID=UPI003F57D772